MRVLRLCLLIAALLATCSLAAAEEPSRELLQEVDAP